MADNESNQASNSTDNYQQMPDEPPAVTIIAAVPDLSPPVMGGLDRPPAMGDNGSPMQRQEIVTGEDPMQPIAPPPTPPDQQHPSPFLGTPPTAAPTPPPDLAPPTPAPWHTPSGAPLDEGFYVWLSHHGVTPGDPNQAYRMEEYKSNYLSLPQSDHDYYVNAGRSDPASHTYNLSGWSTVPGLPPPGSDDDRDELPPAGPPAEPGPPVHEPLPGMDAPVSTVETARFRDTYGANVRAAPEPERSSFDWGGRRLGGRVWSERLRRYV